jgi:thiamine pyrophosphokinase
MKKRLSKQSKTVFIVAGGSRSTEFLWQIRKKDLVIGVDYGAAWLLSQGVVPQVAIGDFDSVSKKQLADIQSTIPQVFAHAPEKDDTDLALAVEHAIAQKPTKVVIWGATGSRMDHTWAAVQLLQNVVSHNIEGEIVDNFNKIYIVRRLRRIPRESGLFPYLSVIPLTKRAIVSIKGCKYDVFRKTFVNGSTLGISNEILQTFATIEVHRGSVLVIQSRD